jgi:hypothetical protein
MMNVDTFLHLSSHNNSKVLLSSFYSHNSNIYFNIYRGKILFYQNTIFNYDFSVRWLRKKKEIFIEWILHSQLLKNSFTQSFLILFD